MDNILIAIIGSSALSALISGLFNLFTNRFKEDKCERQALKLLMLDRLKELASDHLADGNISNTDLAIFVEHYDTYKSLGGDGWADVVYTRVKTLPVVED